MCDIESHDQLWPNIECLIIIMFIIISLPGAT